MSSWLQLPKEAFWLDTSLKVFIRVMKGLWRAGSDLAAVQARSDWVLDQFEIRAWAHRHGSENVLSFIKTAGMAYLLMLLTPPMNAPRDVKDKYWTWIENRILIAVKEQDPDLYSWIVNWYQGQIARVANKELPEGGAT